MCVMLMRSLTIFGARPSEGSSISSNGEFRRRARPIESICCSPPESVPAEELLRSASRGNNSSTVAGVHRFP